MLEKVLKPQYQRDQNNIGQSVKKESRKHFAVLEHKTEASLLCFFLVASVSLGRFQNLMLILPIIACNLALNFTI